MNRKETGEMKEIIKKEIKMKGKERKGTTEYERGEKKGTC